MRGLALATIFLAAPALAQMSPPVPPASPPAHCTAPEHHELDFLLGEWVVLQTEKPDEMIAASTIASAYNGCAIREEWHPFTLYTGGSVANYDTRERVWRMTWMDSRNSRVDYSGTVTDGRVVLTGLWRALRDGKDGLSRLTFWRERGGDVRQRGEISMDEGKTWEPSYDYTYRARNN